MNFYIPGFKSDCNSTTFIKFTKYFPITCLSYDYSDPETSINTLVKQILETTPSSERINIFGSSLGGYVAERIAQRLPCTLFLYNPSLDPASSLSKYDLGSDILSKYTKIVKINQNPRNVIVCTDDTIVSSDYALDLYKTRKLIKTTGGHRMTPSNLRLMITLYQYEESQLT